MKKYILIVICVIFFTTTARAGWVEEMQSEKDKKATETVENFKPPVIANNWLIDFMNEKIVEGCKPAMGGYVVKYQINDIYNEGGGEKSYHGYFKLDNGKNVKFVAAVVESFDDFYLRFITTYDGYWGSRGCRFDDIRLYPKQKIDKYNKL